MIEIDGAYGEGGWGNGNVMDDVSSMSMLKNVATFLTSFPCPPSVLRFSDD